ncbi:DUF4307 domain-containing protein [Nocardioides sp. J2M5]|uniref:DUF4307 domain-containing protein n=1 Tax=Nocardioides palaemonis TaxID=2829810 RepID=UPI001BA8A422|nr:DUF4307 domain-containing protein [Nocardioides palaemonis]MBS2936769.1 DUF4307 domain-containing protein [Nocardioides palaemonis]
MTTDLADRYGSPARWRRPVTIAVTAALAVVGLTWLAWAAWFHGTPEVTSEVVTYEVVSDHAIDARVDVDLTEGVTASCRVRAYAEDHTTVGELAFEPVDGTNTVTIRTERRATSVEKVGCTTADQPRPR